MPSDNRAWTERYVQFVSGVPGWLHILFAVVIPLGGYVLLRLSIAIIYWVRSKGTSKRLGGVLFISIASLAAAIFFGLTAHRSISPYMLGDEQVTDWGKVVLAAVFGFGGIAGLGYYVTRLSDGN